MSLFFSRRSFNSSKGRFTNNPAEKTRYVSVSGRIPASGRWQGSIVSQADWLQQVLARFCLA